MVSENGKTGNTYSAAQLASVAIICLVLGIGLGYLFRGSAPQPAAPAAPSPADPHGGASMGGGAAPGMGQPTPEQMKQMADKAAAPLLEKLQSQPNDAALLAKVGNIYFDTEQFPEAVNFYEKSLAADAANTDVRTDYATCLWYTGNADGAIAEFEKVLKVKPASANALFNLGVVRWQGKMDSKGAVAAWEELLRRNPNYEQRARVEELIARARQHDGMAKKSKG